MKIHGKLQRAKKIVYISAYNLLRELRKVDDKKIVLASNSRDKLSGNLLFINNKIKKLNEYKIKKVLFNTDNFFMNFLFQMKTIFEISNARVVVIDDYFPLLYTLKIRPNTRFVQAWHAMGAFKKIGFSREDGERKLSRGYLTHRNYKDVIVSSENVVEQYSEAFAIAERKIHPIGIPRTDMFFDNDYIKNQKENLYKNYPILENKRIILFAPTFRGKGKKSAYYNFNNIDIDELYKNLNDNEMFILKMHPFIKQKVEIKDEYKDKIIDLSETREINNLLLITDLLITDYSSVIFEYALLNKPILYYIPDYDEYKNNRDFYNDFDEYVYGKKIYNFKELIKNIHIKEIKLDRLNEFKNKYLKMCDGNATNRFVEEIILNNDSIKDGIFIIRILKKILKKTRKVFTGIKILSFSFLMRVLSMLLKLRNDRVLFFSDVRNVLDGNLKFIYDKLDDEKCEKVLCLKTDRKEKRKFKKKIKLLKNIVTSRYIILDDYSRFISLMRVRKGQEVCQLWHGAGAFKKFGYSRQDKNKVKKMNAHRNYTKACVTSDDIRWCYAEGFGMDIEKVKATGMARTDVFFDKEYINKKREELYKEFPYLKDKKIILFAPTYRGKSLKKSYYDYEQLDVEKIYNEFKDKGYVFIFKWHPGLYYQMNKKEIKPYNLEEYPDFYYDFSESRDVNDLLLITDILITDYSSVIFDYSLLNKTLIYFVYDYEEYNQERGLYFDFNDYVYGQITKNTEELIKAINKNDVMTEKRQGFIKQFMEACDGQATKKTCEWIFEDNLNFIKK